jgi:hypothetical protein
MVYSSSKAANNSFYRASGHDIDVVAELLDELVGRQGRPVDARESVKERRRYFIPG